MTTDDLRSRLDAIAGQLEKADEDRRAAHKQIVGRLEHVEAMQEDQADRIGALERAAHQTFADWWKQHWPVVATISTAVPFVLSIMAAGVWSMHGARAIDWLRTELQAAAQNDEILFQPAGLSFIREPVAAGGAATYVLVARRNPGWLDCVYITTLPEFTDELGRTVIGPFRAQGRQYGGELTRTELTLRVPEGLAAGRITLVLSIVYECNDQRLTHRTYPVAFQLLAPPEESER